LSLNIKRRISLYASIVRQVEYDLEDRKVRRWGQHDYSTDGRMQTGIWRS
jgi:hypothetical protein